MVRYFVCKCATFDSLKQCVESGVWACKDRESPPHPREVLTSALVEGRVILLFSVTNCHGWHGVCEMVTAPSDVVTENETDTESKTSGKGNQNGDRLSDTESNASFLIPSGPCIQGDDRCNSGVWHRFRVHWKTVFVREFGERCLSSQLTSDFCFTDGQPINKARNLQELPPNVGQEMCYLIEQYYQQLMDQQEQKAAQQLSRQPAPFLSHVGEDSDIDYVWRQLVQKVERELGKVILACPFGSQRYNLHTADSDMDMFIVYQADTRSVLGLEPPKHTVKNREGESFDYTLHEVHRYCELLTAGDPRCVETLFLHPSTVTYCSAEWHQLQTHQHLFLHSLCLEKYLRDGLGSNGVKQFDKWMKGTDLQAVLSPKLAKLTYIILRLLQNARDVTQKKLSVYREEGSVDRDTLLRVRAREITGQEARDLIQNLLDVIEINKACAEKPSEEMKRQTENWLLKLRYDNLITKPPDIQ